MNQDELLPLDEICQGYFNMSPRRAIWKAGMGALPVPAFRLNSGRKGPMFVRSSDLKKFLEDQVAKAEKLNSKMRAAGVV